LLFTSVVGSDTQEMFSILLKPKAYYSVRMGPSLVNLYSTASKSKRMRWSEHVEFIVETINVYRNLVFVST
jgi:hypothetical protein